MRSVKLLSGLLIGGFSAGLALAQQGVDRTDSARTAEQQVDAERYPHNQTRDPLGNTGLNGTALAPDAEGIRDVLAGATEAALTEGAFDDLIERLVDADRNRLGQTRFPEQEQPQLDQLANRLQEAWQQKYNSEFNIENEDRIYSELFARIVQGEVPEAQTAGQRDADRMATHEDTTVIRPLETDRDDAVGQAGQNDEDRNLEPGRNVAVVTVAASHGLPELRIPLVHEFPDSWKIDVPDSLTAQKLHDNLVQHLNAIQSTQAQWPQDADSAYRVVTHHVLMAVMDVAPGARQQQAVPQPIEAGAQMGPNQ